MTTNESLDILWNRSQVRLEQNLQSIKNILVEENGEISAFVRRVLDWSTNASKAGLSQLLWEFAHNVFDQSDELNFLGNINSFVQNELLDDGSFVIEWRKNRIVNDDLVWDRETNGWETELTTKDDPNGRPVLKRATDDNGTQKVELIMEAMDLIEERDAASRASWKEWEKD